MNQMKSGNLRQRTLRQTLGQKIVDFHGPDIPRRLNQPPCKKSEPRSDFEYLIVGREREKPQDRLDDALVNQKILAEAFSRAKA